MDKLVLIDGHAIIHRAYHALPMMTSRHGLQTNAVYGFISMLLKTIQDLKPTHLAVTFDLPAPTFRHETYIAYQAHRPPSDQELRDQIDLVKEVVKAADIPIYTAKGFEADDVIGTLAHQATKSYQLKAKSSKVDEVVIVTGDRDILQLVNKKVKVFAPIKGLSEAKLFNEKTVKEYMGVKPSKIVDYKALVGDSSDNYPGVQGIGPKTAVRLLEDFGDFDGIYKAIKKKTPKAKKLAPNILDKLSNGYESGLLSKKLAKIVTNAPVKLKLKKAKIKNLSKNKKFLRKLQELGFRSLLARITGQQTKKQPASAQKKKNNQIQLID